jgi:hypothetical protein
MFRIAILCLHECHEHHESETGLTPKTDPGSELVQTTLPRKLTPLGNCGHLNRTNSFMSERALSIASSLPSRPASSFKSELIFADWGRSWHNRLF